MAITLADAKRTIESESFRSGADTSKVAEYISTTTGRVLYLRLNQGFPDHADVVIHPDMDVTALLVIPEIEMNKRVELRFGSNMPRFPKRLNRGEKPEHYGRALHVYSTTALATLCRNYGR